MRSSILSLLAASLTIWATTVAGLGFTAKFEKDGKEIDPSKLDFVKAPATRHWHRQWKNRHHNGTSSGTGGPTSRRDNGKPGKEDISYSENWCGAAHRTTASDPVQNIFAYFTVPDLKLRPNIPAPQFAAAWVGIDGAKCNWTMLQAGVTTVVNSNGGQSASAWWEWFPEATYTIKGLPVKPGDWMSVNITVKDETHAKVVVTNMQRGYAMTVDLAGGPKLCRWDTEWIVEDFYEAETNKQVAFATFSDIWFLDAAATTVGGKNVGIDGSALVHLKNPKGEVLCKSEKYDNSNFVVSSY